MSTRRTLLTAALAALVAMPVSAQTHRVAISLLSGGAMHTDMAAEAASEVRLADGWQAGFQIERWGLGRLGVRLNGSYTSDGLVSDPSVAMNLYTADLDLMLRLRRPEFGKLFMPYIALGAGASLYNQAGDFSTLGGETYGPDPVFRPTALGALGFDIGAGHTVLRFEAFDRVDVMSPLEQGPGPDDFYGPVHHFSASLGLSFRFGGAVMPMMLTEKAPEPTPAPAIEHAALEPEPEPQPQPAPTRSADAVRVEAMAFEIESLQARVADLEQQVAEVAARPPQVVTAAPAADPAATPAVAPVYTGPLFTVQIASYLEGDASRAERVAEDMRAQGIPVWVSRAEVNGRMVRRVRVGALTSESDAHALGMHINRTYSWPFWVSRVEASEPVPPDAIAATRTYLLASRNN